MNKWGSNLIAKFPKITKQNGPEIGVKADKHRYPRNIMAWRGRGELGRTENKQRPIA